MHPLLTDVYKLILNALLPVRCVVCTHESTEALCKTCLIGCTVAEKQVCPACHKPSVAGLAHATCPHTQGLDQLVSLYNYQDEKVKKFIIAGKYKFIPDVFHILGPLMAVFLKNYMNIPEHAVVTPLPLHQSRNRWRGFNQAAILAIHIAQELNIPHVEALVRHRRTKTQKDLRKTERLTNVANCFSLASQADVRKKTVLLVDDVATSGSTLQEAAKILKQHGAFQVIGVTLARD